MSDDSSTKTRANRKVREGLVVSDKMDKTVVVEVEDRVKHALYGKVLRRTRKLKVHDEQNACGIGDRVLLMETRPLSATKRWRVVEILEKAKGVRRAGQRRPDRQAFRQASATAEELADIGDPSDPAGV